VELVQLFPISSALMEQPVDSLEFAEDYLVPPDVNGNSRNALAAMKVSDFAQLFSAHTVTISMM
jgi:hypothetical protein